MEGTSLSSCTILTLWIMLRTKSGPEREVYSCTDDSDSVVQGARGGGWYGYFRQVP